VIIAITGIIIIGIIINMWPIHGPWAVVAISTSVRRIRIYRPMWPVIASPVPIITLGISLAAKA
jgi:hypothetical protein